MSASAPVTPQRPRVAPTVSAPRRNVASQLLKKTGLIKGSGEDISMRDSATIKPQHRSARSRMTLQSKAVEAVKGRAATLAAQRASNINARASTPPESRLPIRSRIPKRSAPQGEKSVVDIWKVVLTKRYNPQSQFLNLDNLANDPDLKNNGIAFNKTRESKEMHVIMKIASQFQPPPITISLANNAFEGPTCFAALHRYLPNIVNLSLTGNKIRTYKDMEVFGGPKWLLKKLRELILLENPIREVSIADGKLEEYRHEITRRFPSLEILDNIPVPHIKFGISPTTPRVPLTTQPAVSFPVPMGPNAVDPSIQPFVFNFLQRFLAAFDSSRPSLHSAYTPLSTFSFSYDSTIPPQSRQRGFLYKLPNQKKLDWKAWHSAGSRNLMKTHHSLQDARDKIYTGADDIIVGLTLLPSTKHVVTEGEKFVVDAIQMDIGAGPQLFINIHGEFTEEPGVIDGIRSFDRALVLAPSPEGSYAKQNGWDAMVLSDQLNIRQYSSHDSWTVGPMKTQTQEVEAILAGGDNAATMLPLSTRMAAEVPGLPTVSPIPGTVPSPPRPGPQMQNPLLNDLADSQRIAVTQLASQTGLNFQYTMMCLEANGWDLALAKKNYDELVSTVPPQIPPEAYIEG